MLRVLFKTSEPCFQCGKSRDTAVVKGPNFSLVLCKDHAWEHVPDKATKEVDDAVDREASCGTA